MFLHRFIDERIDICFGWSRFQLHSSENLSSLSSKTSRFSQSNRIESSIFLLQVPIDRAAKQGLDQLNQILAKYEKNYDLNEFHRLFLRFRATAKGSVKPKKL